MMGEYTCRLWAGRSWLSWSRSAAARIRNRDGAEPAPLTSRSFTDAGEPLARRAAQRLEAAARRAREALSAAVGGRAPLVALVLARGSQLRAARAAAAPQPARSPASSRGRRVGHDRGSALPEGPGPFAALDHEYAHVVLNRSLPAQPLWVAEGLAELLSDGELEGTPRPAWARREPSSPPARVRGARAALEPAAACATIHPRTWATGEPSDSTRARGRSPAGWSRATASAGLRAFLEAIARGRTARRVRSPLAPLGRAQATLLDVPDRRCCAWPRRCRRDVGSPRSSTRRAAPRSSTGWASCCCAPANPPALGPISSALSPTPRTTSRLRIALAEVHLRRGEAALARREVERALVARPATRRRCSTTHACALPTPGGGGAARARGRGAPGLPAGAGAPAGARPVRGRAAARGAAPPALRRAASGARAGARAGPRSHRGGARRREPVREGARARGRAARAAARARGGRRARLSLPVRARARRDRRLPFRDGRAARAAAPRRLPRRRQPAPDGGRAARSAAARSRLVAQLLRVWQRGSER